MRSRVPATGALDDAPGPSPWGPRARGPRVPDFQWSSASQSSEAAGAVTLSGRDGIVLILDFHNYVLVLDPETLLIWHQGPVPDGPTAPVVLRIFKLSALRPLEGRLDDLCVAMRRAGASFAAASPPPRELSIPTTVVSRQRKLMFFEELRHIEELLILCHSSGVEESPPAHRSNLAVLVARPRDGVYQLYPQDWFNRANLDYAYQGVSRIARDPRTGRIHGEGVRIEPFVLDDTLRWIR